MAQGTEMSTLPMSRRNVGHLPFYLGLHNVGRVRLTVDFNSDNIIDMAQLQTG